MSFPNSILLFTSKLDTNSMEPKIKREDGSDTCTVQTPRDDHFIFVKEVFATHIDAINKPVQSTDNSHLYELKPFQNTNSDKLVAAPSMTNSTFVCDICNKSFSNHYNLIRHGKLHNNEETYQCPECPKIYTRKDVLQKHILSHSKLKPCNNTKLEKADSNLISLADVDNTNEKQTNNSKQNGETFFCISNNSECNKSFTSGNLQGPFICSICGKSFSLKNNLIRHGRLHSNEVTYQCPDCDKIYTRKDVLQKHILSHSKLKSCNNTTLEKADSNLVSLADVDNTNVKQTNNSKPNGENIFCVSKYSEYNKSITSGNLQRPFICSICGKSFALKSKLNQHLQCSHSNERSFSCPICFKSFKQNSSLKKHNQSHHLNTKPFACNLCDKRFNQKSTLESHIVVHSCEKPHKCSTCGARFGMKSSLYRHVRKHLGDKPHKCDICQKEFFQRSQLKAHCLKHTGEKPFVCDICNKGFQRRSQLNNHHLIHSSADPYECNVCEKKFMLKSQLHLHYRIHTKNRPFVCDICNVRYRRKNSLIEHRRLHTGEKPHVCEFCHKAFSSKAKYCRHKMIHTGRKPYVCQICQKAFNQNNALKRHYVVHTLERPYVCDVCNKGFSQKSYLSIHRISHTGKRPYVCELCEKTFLFRTHLLKHVCEGILKIESENVNEIL